MDGELKHPGGIRPTGARRAVLLGLGAGLLLGCAPWHGESETPPEGPAEADAEAKDAGEASSASGPIVLQDQDGKTLRFRDLAGRAMLVSFVYTRCPSPNMCPLTTRKVVRLQRELAEVSGRVRLLLITLDPEYDTPRVLREYGEVNGADFSNLWLLTGTEENLARLWKLFGIHRQVESPGVIAHTMDLFFLDASGNFVKVFPGSFWDVSDVAYTILEFLEKTPAAAAAPSGETATPSGAAPLPHPEG